MAKVFWFFFSKKNTFLSCFLAAYARRASFALAKPRTVKLGAALNMLHLKGATLRRYDSALGIAAIFVSPTHFGFTDDTDPCNNSCPDPAHTFFWDSIHPGQTGHMLLGSAFLALIAQ